MLTKTCVIELALQSNICSMTRDVRVYSMLLYPIDAAYSKKALFNSTANIYYQHIIVKVSGQDTHYKLIAQR